MEFPLVFRVSEARNNSIPALPAHIRLRHQHSGIIFSTALEIHLALANKADVSRVRVLPALNMTKAGECH
jgi:hypothetical protein